MVRATNTQASTCIQESEDKSCLHAYTDLLPPILPYMQDGAGHRRTSFNRLQDAEDKKWRSTAIECWIASDASAVVEHTKRCVHRLLYQGLGGG